jgi:hypothetical protein
VTEFSRLARISGGLGAAVILLWLGYDRERGVREALEERPATEKQRVLTANALNKLRVVFSAGACQSIYDDASQYFRSQTEVDWLYQCNQLRDSLGAWQGFQIRSTTTYGAPKQFVLVEGSAAFAKASRHFGATWLPDTAGARLYSLSLEEDGKWKQIPPVTPGLFMDPPPNGIIEKNELLASAPVCSKDQRTVLPCLPPMRGCFE